MVVFFLSWQLSFILSPLPRLDDTFGLSMNKKRWRYFVGIFHRRINLFWSIAVSELRFRIVKWLGSYTSTSHSCIAVLLLKQRLIPLSFYSFNWSVKTTKINRISKSKHPPTLHFHLRQSLLQMLLLLLPHIRRLIFIELFRILLQLKQYQYTYFSDEGVDSLGIAVDELGTSFCAIVTQPFGHSFFNRKVTIMFLFGLLD